MNDYVTVGELAEELGCQAWRVARLFELGVLPEPPRAAGRRLIPRAAVPAVARALGDRGWLRVPHKGPATGRQSELPRDRPA